MSNKIIIANWKSNKNLTEARHWLTQAVPQLATTEATIIVAPAFPFVALVSETLKNTNLKTGVQDLSPFPAGAYTGAVGSKNLEHLGVTYAIVGHSERRRYFHETNNEIANKVREALLAGITPVVCVTKDTVSEQAHSLESGDRKKIVVAFEPVEHIGTGVADTLEDILTTKKLVAAAFGEVPYLYGGSVDPKTDREVLRSSEIDGFLVGTASLSPQEFVKLVQLIA